MKIRGAFGKWLTAGLLAAAFGLLWGVGGAGAAGGEAETIAPGTKITQANWQQYKQFFTQGEIAVWEGNHFWHFPPKAEIVIGKTIPIGRPRTYIEATEKYAGQVKLDRLSDGGYTIKNYTAGAPFPFPEKMPAELAGEAVHYDAYYRPQPRVEEAPNCTTALDRYGNMTRTSDTNVDFQVMTHLAEPTYPQTIPGNGGYYRASYIEQTAPEQGKYTAILLLTPDDPTRVDEMYTYVPSLRRSLRLSQAARCAPLFGTDFTWEDLDGGPPGLPQMFKMKFLGKKKLIALVHQTPDAYKSCGTATGLPPKYYLPGGKQTLTFPTLASGDWEVRDVYVVQYERLPQYARGYCYGRRVLYLDADTLFPLAIDLYDSAMKLYKMLLLFNLIVPIPHTSPTEHLLTLTPAAGYTADFLDEHASTYIGTIPCIDHDCDAGGWDNISRYASPDGLMKIVQ
jgi:Protein of unknown function (DUF1329)